MSVVQPIPRNGLLWLLVAQVLVILPHLGHLPLWIIGLWLTCATWRVQIFRMRARYPRSWVKAAMMIGTGAGVYLSRGSLIGLDAGAVLLIAAFILKLVEMRSQRDALVLVFWASLPWLPAICSMTAWSPVCTACFQLPLCSRP